MDKITGMYIYYYFVCKRKLWYFINQLDMEDGNENVSIGRLLDENAYKSWDKHIMIDGVINIDYIAEHRMLHEIKKSRKMEDASVWQVKYYLYYLKKRGVTGLKGRIDYPLLKKSKDVELTENDEVELDRICEDIIKISKDDKVPERTGKKICRSCAYYEFCFI